MCLLALLVLPVIYTSCLDFSTSPDEILYLTFERLPYPAIVSGDTLRDSTGVVTSLSAVAVNGVGDELPNTQLRFYALDDTADALDVDSLTGRVVSEIAAPQSVRIVAAIGSLQSPPLALTITLSPDSLALVLASDTITYSFADTNRNFSDQLAVKVLHHDSTTFFSPVTNWVVRYSLERPADTVFAAIVDDQNRRLRNTPSGLTHIDTTAADGSAGRKLRIRPGPPLATPIDSVAVLVEAKYRGAHVAGSPARIFVYVRPGS